MNANEAREKLEMARKAFAETWKQVRPLEEDLTAYRAVFIALGMFSPQVYGPGGSMDLKVVLEMARESSAVQTVMKNRDDEVSKVIAAATTSMELQISELKQPIGFNIPK